jgi:hypothetical protein
VEGGVSASKRARKSAFSSKRSHFIQIVALIVLFFNENVFIFDPTAAKVSAEYFTG